MGKSIIFLSLILWGCATPTPPVLDKPLPPAHAIIECDKVKEFTAEENTFRAAIDKYLELLDSYDDCNKKHEALRLFINSSYLLY